MITKITYITKARKRSDAASSTMPDLLRKSNQNLQLTDNQIRICRSYFKGLKSDFRIS